MLKLAIGMAVSFAMVSVAAAADIPRKQPVPVAVAPVGKAPIGKAPVGKAPIGKTPIGKAPIGKGPVIAKG